MTSNRWQKQHFLIQQGCLAIVCGFPIIMLQLNMAGWLRLALIVIVWVGSIWGAAVLNNRYATTYVRVYRFDYEIAASVVQQVLKQKYIRYQRQIARDKVSFGFRDHGLTMTIESYPLNMPMDDRIKPILATKVALRGLNDSNEAFVMMLSEAIEEMADVRIAQLRARNVPQRSTSFI